MWKLINQLPYVCIGLFICSILKAEVIQTKQPQSQPIHSQPNIVIIYADDMGYGDLQVQNPESKIPTPNLNQIAQQGLRFTDAHSSSGICSPSRYALLTGKYHWRVQHDIVNSFEKPFFRNSDHTLPQFLKDAGYVTAAIGKWHLGWNWPFKNEPSGRYKARNKQRVYYKASDIDWKQPITGGPLKRGFDYYFGDGTINFPPYTWIENEKVLAIPTENLDIGRSKLPLNEGKWEFRRGPGIKGWNPYEVMPTLTKKAIKWIGKRKVNQPFFLYFALPSPHAPIIPNKEFIGTSKAGPYGDYVVQTDWVAGQIVKALKDNGLEKNTLVIFSSDNGPEHYAFNRASKYQHFSMGKLRGLKRDVWEGGHRVPMLMKWPGTIKGNSVSKEVVSQVDLFATIAAIVNKPLPKSSAPDSYNLLPLLTSQPYLSPLREATVQNTYQGIYALRKGNWLYINSNSGEHSRVRGDFQKLRNPPIFNDGRILFNLSEDLAQEKDLSKQQPERMKAMDALLTKYRQQGYSIKRE